MTAFKRFVFVMVVVMGLWFPAQAAKQKKVIIIPRPCVIQGQNLVPGTYVVEFEDGQDGTVVIGDGRRELVRAPYKLKPLAKPSEGDTLEFSNQDGTRQIVRISFKGMTRELRFE